MSRSNSVWQRREAKGGGGQIIGKKRREIVFAKCQEVKVYDAASSYLMSELKEFVLPHVNLYTWGVFVHQHQNDRM